MGGYNNYAQADQYAYNPKSCYNCGDVGHSTYKRLRCIRRHELTLVKQSLATAHPAALVAELASVLAAGPALSATSAVVSVTSRATAPPEDSTAGSAVVASVVDAAATVAAARRAIRAAATAI